MTTEFEYISERKHSPGSRTPLLTIEEDEEVAAELTRPRGASFHGSIFNLSCSVIGSGIMSLPATLKVLGLVPGVALIIIAAFLTDASIEMLLRFSKPGSAFSYSDLMDDAFGKIGKILLQISVIINNIGCLIVYMIIIGRMCYLDQHQVGFTVLVFWKDGVESTGGLDVPLFFLS